jgi:recombination protein RecR
MTMYPAPLARLIQELSKLPGIGEKSAARLAFHMLKENGTMFSSPTASAAAQEMGYATVVSASAKSCPERRRHNATFAATRARGDKICVVEEPADMIAVECRRVPRPVSCAARHDRRLTASARACASKNCSSGCAMAP